MIKGHSIIVAVVVAGMILGMGMGVAHAADPTGPTVTQTNGSNVTANGTATDAGTGANATPNGSGGDATNATSDATNASDSGGSGDATSDATGDATDSEPAPEPEPEPDPEPEPAVSGPPAGGDLTKTQLTRDGTRVGESPESVRLQGRQMWWAVHWPAGGVGTSPGDPTDPNFEYLTSETVVDRNAVWLRTVNIREPYTQTVTVATYDLETTEDYDGSTTTQPANVSVQQQEIEVGQGWVISEISLPPSDDKEHVAMWMGDDPDTELRWVFDHQTTTSAQGLPFSTYGGLFGWVGPWFVLPLIIGSVTAIGGAKAVVRRTGVGPGLSTAQWSFLFGTGAFLFVWAYYGEVTQLIVDYPFIPAVYISAYLFAVSIDRFTAYTSLVRFIQPTLNAVTSPKGSTAADQIEARERTARLIDRPDEPGAVASDGLVPFLARLASGKAATLRTVDPGHEAADHTGETNTEKDPLQCRVPVTNGAVDEKIITHPKMDEPIDYTPEGFQFAGFDSENLDFTSALLAVGVIGAVALAANAWFGPTLAATVAVVGVAVWRVEAVEGEARLWLSPLHYRSARATAQHLAAELDDADTISEEREKRLRQAMDTEKKIMREADRRDETLMDGLYSFASGGSDDPDDEPGGGFGLEGLGRPDDYPATDGGEEEDGS